MKDETWRRETASQTLKSEQHAKAYFPVRTSRPSTLTTREVAAYGLVMLGSSCLNNIFATYYIELFCYVLDISSGWFYVGQVLFMIWNTINDPLFGWLSDYLMVESGGGGRRLEKYMMKRANSVKWGGTIWAIAFMTVWFPPSQDTSSPALLGIYFAFCLCFYDGLLTFVEVNHSAMLSEITTDVDDRTRCNLSAAAFATIGSMTSFFGHWYWDHGNLQSFRRLCLIIALVATSSFHISAQLFRSRRGAAVADRKMSGVDMNGHEKRVRKEGEGKSVSTAAALRRSLATMRDLSRSRNGMVYGGVNFLQCFDCTFQKNFFPIFLVYFAAGQISQSSLSAIVAMSFVLPWLATSLYTNVVRSRGLHETLTLIFNIRLLVIVICLVVSSTVASATISCALLLTNRVLSESVCRLSPLVVADLVDEDMCRRRRKHTVAATVVGAASAVGKMSQSLAPILGYALIPSASIYPTVSHVSRLQSDEGEDSGSIYLGQTIALILLVIVSMQRLLWSRYTLHGSHLKSVKEQVHSIKSGWSDMSSGAV